MDKIDRSMICKSCAKPLKKSYMLCYQCHISADKAQCSHIKRTSGEQCRNMTIKGKCIFHINDS